MTGQYSTTPEAWAERRAEVSAGARAAAEARDGLPVCCPEGRCEHGCPRCPDSYHPRCVFASGSLACVTPDCGNPHHRAAP